MSGSFPCYAITSPACLSAFVTDEESPLFRRRSHKRRGLWLWHIVIRRLRPLSFSFFLLVRSPFCLLHACAWWAWRLFHECLRKSHRWLSRGRRSGHTHSIAISPSESSPLRSLFPRWHPGRENHLLVAEVACRTYGSYGNVENQTGVALIPHLTVIISIPVRGVEFISCLLVSVKIRVC